MAAVAFSLTLILAGCVGSEPDSGSDSDLQTSPPAAEFDETTGAIRGEVLTDEFEPIQGAEVGLLGSSIRALTAQDGGFTLNRVPPGEQRVLVSKLGYHPGEEIVIVEAGQATDLVTIELTPLPRMEPRFEIFQFTGFITCSVGAAQVISEECGQGLQTDFGTFGKNERNNIDWKFNVTTVDHLTAVHLEMDWTPASAAAKKLGFHVAHGFSCTPACDSEMDPYCDVFENFGPPVQRCHIPSEELGVKDPATELPWDLTARAWAAPVNETEVPNIVFEQAVTMYRTDFYDMPMPNDYTAVPPD